MLDGQDRPERHAGRALCRRRSSPFVAGFFGPVNRFKGRVVEGTVATPVGTAPAGGLADGAAVQAIVRPEALRVHRRPDGGGLRARVLVRA